MDIQTAVKLGEVMDTAASISRGNHSLEFAECVGTAFWRSFERYEQSHLMQEIYSILCDMGYTPLERYNH